MSDEVQPRGGRAVLAIAASLCRAVLAIAPASAEQWRAKGCKARTSAYATEPRP